jgi:hypothetical protein
MTRGGPKSSPFLFYGKIMSNVTRTPPLNQSIVTAFVNASSLGSNVVLAAVPGKSIRVIDVAVVTTLANTVSFLSSAGAITAAWPLGANGGLVLPFNEHGWFQTNAGEGLNVNLGVATATGVHINYIVL